LDHVRPDDFHLALGCAEGDPVALTAFERHFKADLERLVHRYQGPRLMADDLLQSLREKLFVATDRRPAKIRDYSGQGFLQNWLRVTGARTCIDLLRSTSRQDREQSQDDQQIMAIPDLGPNLELDFLKREYREQFKEAFAAATRTLNSRQRNLLRQHFVFQLTMEQLGNLYNVHPSTASRRVSKAREALLEATRTSLMEKLNVNQDEFDSIMRMIRSRIDLSLTRLLQTHAG
ncbi:MAG: sigma-70 family RNA polymerase sigma factor, partial [Myxococcota bacterium]